jgi:hypothetical protein
MMIMGRSTLGGGIFAAASATAIRSSFADFA